VDFAKPGQILAEELARHDGVLLASQGSEVTEGLIRMLHRQNIDTICIEEDERRTKEEIQAEHTANLLRLDDAFQRVEGEAVLMALKKTLIFMSKQEMDKSLEVLELLELGDAESSGGAASEEAAPPEEARTNHKGGPGKSSGGSHSHGAGHGKATGAKPPTPKGSADNSDRRKDK
jgi:hypothetical protein